MRIVRYFVIVSPLACVLLSISPAVAGPVLGDWDQDADIDLADFAQLTNCFFSANQPDPDACAIFNFSPGSTISISDHKLFLCGFKGPGAAVDAVTVNPPQSPTPILDVLLTGTTAGAVQVQISGGLQTVTVPTSACNYSAAVQVQPNSITQLFLTGIYGNGIPSAPVAVSVVHDMQPPNLFIDFPADGAEITTPTIDVAGRVNDMLSGFAGLVVTVHGMPAAVNIGVGTNGTFFAPGVPLTLGTNTITAVAVDAVSNSTQQQISVTRIAVPPDAAQLHVVSGNAQSAPVQFALPQPIVARVTNLQGMPLAGKIVNFHVTRSDGRLGANAAPPIDGGTMMLQVFTDTSGEARAFWRLGTDAGMGNNRIEVTSSDVIGTTLFCASALPGAPLKVNVGTGNNQRGEAGAPAAEPLVVWANDSCNPVASLPITFTVTLGGGKVNGQDEVTVATGATGHAGVNFTYGPDTGNNAVVATFAGNPTAAARFVLHGVKRDPLQSTRLTGIVLDNGEQPLRNATCTLTVPSPGVNAVVLTDINGQFAFESLSVSGAGKLRVDGSTVDHIAGTPGMDVPPNSYPAVPFKLVLVPNATNTLPSPALLPKLNPNNTRLYSTTQDTELTIEGIAGLKMIVKAGSMTLDQNGTLVPAPDGTPIMLNQVHHDDVPMPMTDGAAPPFAWTLKPAGAHFNPPIKVEYPNMSGLPAGSIANFLSFNHDIGKFQIVASGSVSEDGMQIITDPGSGLTIAGWGCNCPPYSVTGDCCHCSDCPEGSGPSCCIDPCPICRACEDGQCAPVSNGTSCGPCKVCVNGVCIPTTGTPCGEQCCQAGQSCCVDVCVSPDSLLIPCGSNCCFGAGPNAEQCCNGMCIPQSQCCGGPCLGCEVCIDQQCVDACSINDPCQVCDSVTQTCVTMECPECTQCAGSDGCVAVECGACVCLSGTCHCGEPCTQCQQGECVPCSGACCNNSCAPPGSECCDAAPQGLCAPPNGVCCPGIPCCPSGTTCCEGTQGAACCDTGFSCCVGPLGTSCCSSGQSCINGLCQ